MTQIPNEKPVWQTRRFRLIVFYGSLGLLALILILQNFDTTEVQFLFWRAEAALAWVLITFMILGAGVDELVRVLVRRRHSKRAAAMPREHPDSEF
ncbi:MAG: LapA family protein [Acidimicrobiia bacterium]